MVKILTATLGFLMMTCSQTLANESYQAGDTFYCNESAVAFTNPDVNWKAAIGSPGVFRFNIYEDSAGGTHLTFGNSGYFAHTSMKVQTMSGLLTATNENSSFHLANGRFTYAGANIVYAVMRSGTCDKF